MTERAAIILAGGQGSRMASGRAKVLHRVGGRPMLDWSADLARRLDCDRMVVVIPPDSDAVREAACRAFGEENLCVQAKPLGTGDAVRATVPHLAGFTGTAIVLYADTPLVPVRVCRDALAGAGSEAVGLAVVGFTPAAPSGYGRLVMEGEYVRAIVEERDASATERTIGLCNSGVVAGSWPLLRGWLERLSPSDLSGEYYLTDVVGLAVADGYRPAAVLASEDEVAGVNSLEDMVLVETAFQRHARAAALARGVEMRAPETVFFSFDTEIEPGAFIEPYVVFGPGVCIGRGARIGSFSHIEGAQVGNGASIGPFARLRPGTDIRASVRVGNFVEIKNARLGEGASAAHLAYVGDAIVGARANLGAGTVCCNYDGDAKHSTDIGAGAFIGSNSSLVAPVKVGPDAYVGSGSVIVDDVAEGALALARARQVEKPGWTAARRQVEKPG